MLRTQNLTISQPLSPVARTNGTANGTGVDIARFDAVTIKFDAGVVTDGTHTPKIQESDDNSTFTDVAAGDQGGTLAVIASNVGQTVSYRGGKRYVRPVITTAGATTGAIAGATVVLGHNMQNDG